MLEFQSIEIAQSAINVKLCLTLCSDKKIENSSCSDFVQPQLVARVKDLASLTLIQPLGEHLLSPD